MSTIRDILGTSGFMMSKYDPKKCEISLKRCDETTGTWYDDINDIYAQLAKLENSLETQITRAAHRVAVKTRRGLGNTLLLNPDDASLIKGIELFNAILDVNIPKGTVYVIYVGLSGMDRCFGYYNDKLFIGNDVADYVEKVIIGETA